MTASTQRAEKAATLAVFRNADETYTVPGIHAAYTIGPNRFTGELRCNCPAFFYGKPCSHIDRVKALFIERAP